MRIVDGRKIAKKILEEQKKRIARIANLGHTPTLAVFLIGEDPASLIYVRAKEKIARKLKIRMEVLKFDSSIPQKQLVDSITSKAQQQMVSGIIIQLPLPSHLNEQEILDAVPPDLDVDVLGSRNKTALANGKDMVFIPPAAGAVLEILKYLDVDLAKKEIVIIGAGDLVGKPLASLFLSQGYGFKMANRYTENLSALAKTADVLVSGVGKPGLVTAHMVKPGAVVIDAGTTGSSNATLRGDVEFSSVSEIAGAITPVPGGVGPVTIALLFANVVRAAEIKSGHGGLFS